MQEFKRDDIIWFRFRWYKMIGRVLSLQRGTYGLYYEVDRVKPSKKRKIRKYDYFVALDKAHKL